MPLSVGLGSQRLEFSGVHALLAITFSVGLLYLTVQKVIGPEAYVGVAVAAINGYLEFRRNGKGANEKPPAPSS